MIFYGEKVDETEGRRRRIKHVRENLFYLYLIHLARYVEYVETRNYSGLDDFDLQVKVC